MPSIWFSILPTTTDVASDDDDDDDDENNANKWHATMINFFKDFEKIHLSTMQEWLKNLHGLPMMLRLQHPMAGVRLMLAEPFLSFSLLQLHPTSRSLSRTPSPTPACGMMVLSCGLS